MINCNSIPQEFSTIDTPILHWEGGQFFSYQGESKSLNAEKACVL